MTHRPIRLLSTALEGLPFHVRSIERSEEPHGFYRFDVELTIASEHVEGLSGRERSLLRSRVALIFEDAGAEQSHLHGMIAARSPVQRTEAGGASLRLTVRPRVWVMTSMRATETVRDLTVLEILTRKLQAAGLKEREDFVFAVQSEHRVREFAAQLGESDLDFVCRLCDDVGIGLSFEHGSGRDVLVFSDLDGASPP